MKLALVPLNPTLGDVTGNLERILLCTEQAIAQKCHLIVFPELSLVGYPPKDHLFFEAIIQQQNKALEILKRKSKWITIVVGGITKNHSFGARLKNEVFILQNGQRTTYAKQLLPNYDVFDEHRYFEPGRDSLILKICGKKCGFTICEDIWTRSDTPETTYSLDPLARYQP